MAQNQRTQEFVEALDAEIKALKDNRRGGAVRVTGGKLVSVNAGYFVYRFLLENFLTVMDDTPVEVEIDGARHMGGVVAVQGLEIHVALEVSFERGIDTALLRINNWAVLELIKKRFEDAEAGPDTRFAQSEAVFSGLRGKFTEDLPYYDTTSSQPNASQIVVLSV